MENQPVTTPVVTKRPSKKPLLLIGLLVIVLLVGGIYYVNHSRPKTKSDVEALPVDWAQYKSTQFGFKFSYPKEWGTPDVHVNEAGRGKAYSVGFFKPGSKSGENVSISIQSDNVTNPDCSSKCGLSSESIKKQLSSSTEFYYKDGSSYALITTAPSIRIQSALNIDQIVNLPKINASAADFSYYIPGNYKDCPSNKLSSNENKNCITETQYQTAYKVLRSLETL